MGTGAIVSLSLQKGDEMMGQMVDGSCNPSVIGTGVLTCIYIYINTGKMYSHTPLKSTLKHCGSDTMTLSNGKQTYSNFLLEKKQH